MASSCDVSTGNCPKFTLPNPGDTGTGKTSVVQHVGRLLGREAPIKQCGHATSSNGAEFQVAEVLVYNFNEQSESTELIGGFRPVACDSGGILSTIFQINLGFLMLFKTCRFCGSKDNVMQLMSELVWILEHQNLLLDRVAGEKRDKFFFFFFAKFKPKNDTISTFGCTACEG